MNWLDFVIGFVALVGLFIGWRVGLLGAIFNTLGVFVGIFLGAQFSDDISGWITEQGAADSIATVLSYVVIIIAVFAGAQMAKNAAKKMLSLVFLGWVDTLGSVAVGALLGFGLAGALILGLARFSSDLPTEGALGTIVEMTGLRGSLQDTMVESSLIPVFIDFTDAIPGSALGFVPGDYRLALEQLELRIERLEQG